MTAADIRGRFIRDPAGSVVVEWDGARHVLRASRGLEHLIRLIEQPGTDIHVSALTSADAGRGSAAPAELSSRPAAGLDAALDDRAKRDYKRRIAELEAEEQDALDANDPERATQARVELDFIVGELTAAVGLGGRDRPQGDDGERARVAVTKALGRAIAALRRQIPSVGEHLDRSVRRGYECSYDPDVVLLASGPAPAPPTLEPVVDEPPAPHQPTRDQRLIGRSDELDALDASFRTAERGTSGTCLVTGEGGIGKTRLAAELAAVAAGAGATVVWGRCWEEAGAPAYWPWVQAVEALASERGVEHAAEVVGLANAHDSITEHDRFRTADTIRSQLCDAAAIRPLVVVIDDLQWADLSSIHVLSYLSRFLADARVLIVATVREAELTTEQRGVIAGVERVASVIDLTGLEQDLARDLAADVLGYELTSELSAHLFSVTAGNPYFVRELAPILAVEPKAPGSDVVAVPRSISHLLGRSIERLPSDDRPVLDTAATVGREFSPAVVAQALGRDVDDVVGALDRAHGVGLVHEIGAARWSFVHDLVRSHVLGELSVRDRARRHWQVAEALDASGTSGRLHERAHHALAGALAGSPDDAVALAVQAADDALAGNAAEEAVGLLRRALDLIDGLVEPAATTRCDVLIRLASSQARAELLESRDTALQAVGLAEHEDRTMRARAAIALTDARSLHIGDAAVQAEPEAIRALDALLAHDDVDPSLRIELLSCRARELHATGSRADPLPFAEEAMQLAERADVADGLRGVALRSMATALTWHPEEVDRRRQVAHDVVRLGAATDRPVLEAWGHVDLLSLALELGDRRMAETELEVLDRLATRAHSPHIRGHALTNRVAFAGLDGRLDDAARQIEDSREALSAVGPHFARPLLFHQMYLDLERGDIANYLGVVDGLVAVEPDSDQMRALACAVYVEVGDHETGRRLLAELGVGDGFRGLRRDPGYLAVLWLLTRASCRLGDTVAARSLEERWEPFRGRYTALPSNAGVWLGAVSHHLGCLAAVGGRYDEARELLEDGWSKHLQMGATIWALRSQMEIARLDLARGGTPDDLGPLHDAATAAGAGDLVAEIERLTDVAAAEAFRRPAGGDRAGTFTRADGTWTVGFGSDTFSLPDRKGLGHLAVLLARPGQPVHVLDLTTGIGAERSSGDDGVDGRPGDLGPVLDAEAKQAFRRRVEMLRAEADDALSAGDDARARAAQDEIDDIARQLGAAVGLGGRDRRMGDAAERARVNVARTIRAAIDVIDPHDRALAHHLRTCVQTGTFCVYEPDPAAPVHWQV